MRGGWVYIMTNRPNGTLYAGLPQTSPDAHTSIEKGYVWKVRLILAMNRTGAISIST
jgi:hypothetical protein